MERVCVLSYGGDDRMKSRELLFYLVVLMVLMYGEGRVNSRCDGDGDGEDGYKTETQRI